MRTTRIPRPEVLLTAVGVLAFLAGLETTATAAPASRFIERAHLLNHLCLAEIHRTRGHLKKARGHLRFIIDAPYQADRRPENVLEKAAATDMLESIGEEEES